MSTTILKQCIVCQGYSNTGSRLLSNNVIFALFNVLDMLNKILLLSRA